MSYQMSLAVKKKQAQSLKQNQRLIMSLQMQQAIHLLQMPLLELSTTIGAELEQNPVLESLQEEELDQENASLELETQEPNEESEMPPEKELDFKENDFEILRRLDEDFRDYFAESGNFFPKRTVDEENRRNFWENSICAEITLFEHLMNQAKETFNKTDELAVAEVLIGSFDERGFLQTPLEEIASANGFDLMAIEKVLKEIQTFDPPGIGATSLRESLLIQLRRQNQENFLSYAIVEKHYDDMIHNRVPMIKKGLHCTTEAIANAIERHISKLDLHPGAWFSRRIAQPIVPDAVLRQDEDKLIVEINEESLPSFRLNARYLRMLDDASLPAETKEFIKSKILSAKWLVRNIYQRNDTLQKIVESLAKKQKEFFLQVGGKLNPLTMKVLSEELGLHESTIARAVANKYLDCPRGLLPLRYFFSNAYLTSDGTDISSKTVMETLLAIIHEENKQKPLSDEAISTKLKEKGISCARRTVAKYRSKSNIGTAQHRKKF